MNSVKLSVLLVLFAACNPGQTSSEDKEMVQATTSFNPLYYSDDRTHSKPIPIDTANRMIQSYLTSIHPEDNPYETRSLIFQADILRDYLNDSSHGKIEHLKMVLAHQLSYINAGHFGQRPDSNSEALTLVLVGYGENGNYIYFDGDKALNVCQPCPRECPEAGTAASDLLLLSQ